MRAHLVATLTPLAVISLASCGPLDLNGDGITDGPKSPTQFGGKSPSTPMGAISGQVLTTSAKPLEGATIIAFIEATAGQPSQATSDASGFWYIPGVPGLSGVEVSIAKAGYATARTVVSVPARIGQEPVADTNVFAGRWMLSELSGTVQFRVLTSTGRPAKGARGVLEVSPTAFLLDNGSICPQSLRSSPIISAATVDDSGVLTFGGVPAPGELYQVQDVLCGDPQYRLIMEALDETGDGVPDSAGLVRSFSASDLLAGTQTLVQLVDARSAGTTPFVLLASNVGSLLAKDTPTENMLAPAEAIYLAFSHNVQATSLLVRLTDETGQRLLTTNSVVSGQMVIAQPADPLELGKEYNIAVHAVSGDTGAVVESIGYLFGANPSSPMAVGLSVSFRDTGNGLGGPPDGRLNPGEPVAITFNQPVGYFGDLASTGLTSPPQIVYFDRDLDGSGFPGNADGEVGYSGPGFDLYLNEPVTDSGAIFALRRSGYTTKFKLAYLGPTSCPEGTRVEIDFSRLRDSTTGAQTIWGQPLRSTLSALLSVSP